MLPFKGGQGNVSTSRHDMYVECGGSLGTFLLVSAFCLFLFLLKFSGRSVSTLPLGLKIYSAHFLSWFHGRFINVLPIISTVEWPRLCKCKGILWSWNISPRMENTLHMQHHTTAAWLSAARKFSFFLSFFSLWIWLPVCAAEKLPEGDRLIAWQQYWWTGGHF